MSAKAILIILAASTVVGCGESNDLAGSYTPAMQMEDEIAAREHARICASTEEREKHPEEGCEEK